MSVPHPIPWTEQSLRKRAAELETDNTYWREVDGRAADQQARLFNPAPAVIPGQTHIDTEEVPS